MATAVILCAGGNVGKGTVCIMQLDQLIKHLLTVPTIYTERIANKLQSNHANYNSVPKIPQVLCCPIYAMDSSTIKVLNKTGACC